MASMMMSSSRTAAFGGCAPRRAAVARCPLTVTCAYGTTPKVGGGKNWKHTEVNHNGNPVKVPMHVKKGDTVQVRLEAGCGGRSCRSTTPRAQHATASSFLSKALSPMGN